MATFGKADKKKYANRFLRTIKEEVVDSAEY
jgi:hypothetical protein